MKEFPLGGGFVAKVDDEDWEMLIQHRWHLRKCSRITVKNGFYAKTNITLPDGKRTTLEMHRLIMQPAKGMVIDHIDGDGLNNQRSNLRICTPAQNARNRQKSRKSRLPKGVFLVRGKKYGAQIHYDGHKYYNGLSYETIEDAARAYNELAIRFHGEFAHLNVVDADSDKS